MSRAVIRPYGARCSIATTLPAIPAIPAIPYFIYAFNGRTFRAQLRSVQDLPFFMFRASMIFG